MARTPPAPKNTRNGLKWRDARPRWEPSPASRAAGLRGVDLKDLEGRWIAERGVAIAVCDARQVWAGMIREAAQDPEAAAELRAALEGLGAPQTAEQRLRRLLTQDLVDAAQALLAGRDVAEGVSLTRGPRSTELLVDAYFAAVDAGAVEVKPATRKAYWSQRGRFLAKFPGRGVASIRRMELHAWYHDKQTGLLVTESPATANLCMAAAQAFLKHAMNLEWIEASPAHHLGLKKTPGRLVFWTLEEELAFAAWCDANGFADVGDGVTAGCWTGARISDLCGADLQELAGPIWKYTPGKTEAHDQVAMPGIVDQVRARIDRRRAEAEAAAVRYANATPFLWNPDSGRRHDVQSYWERFVKAKAQAIADDAVPAALADKKQQDTRDTCITRLWAAKVGFDRMWTWTGHAKDSIERICRDHYLTLLEAGQLEMAQQLQAWADAEALRLA